MLTHLFFPGCVNLVGGLAHLERSPSHLSHLPCTPLPMGPMGPLALQDLARLPGLLCLGSAELVLPCSLPCLALPRPPASLISKGDCLRLPPQIGAAASLCGFPYEACSLPRQGKARQTARQDPLNRAKAKQARQPSQIRRIFEQMTKTFFFV